MTLPGRADATSQLAASSALPPSALAEAARRRLGDVMVEAGLLTAEQLATALEHQRDSPGARRRLGQVVTELGLASEKDVASCLSKLLGLNMVDLSRTVPAPDVVRLLPRQIAERTRVLVVDRTATGLLVATADPTNVLALDDVRLHTGAHELTVLVATDSQIREQINRAWALGQDNAQVAALTDDDDGDEQEQLGGTGADDDAPVVKLVNQVLADAVRMRASDIHVEVQRDALRVRYRVDGLLRDVMNVPRRAATSMISRIKIISGLDIAERRIPQDGRTRFVLDGMAIDARVSTLPALHGEKVVIRLLSRGDSIPKLAGLGFDKRQLKTFNASLNTPQGLVLITGPTGSGKTNTLYSAIAEISTPDKNIITLEDPVEVQLPGITQVGINVKSGMTFAAGLRSVLRQDPDIVLVGEVRDGETAELALKAAMTGHLVLTTLHTNSAVSAITRLVDMGIEPFMVASSLTCAIAQRLVRTPCPNCVQPYEPDDITLAGLGMTRSDLATATPRRGTGCSDCGDTGYRGRTAVYEVLAVDEGLRSVLLTDPTESAISAQAREAGMTTLRGAALAKALRGETTFEEAVRVTHSDHGGGSACPACSRKVQTGMLVCPYCATTLDRGSCTGCSMRLEADWRICPWCRTPAPEPEPITLGSPAAPAPAAAPVPQQAAAQPARQPAAPQQPAAQQPAAQQPVAQQAAAHQPATQQQAGRQSPQRAAVQAQPHQQPQPRTAPGQQPLPQAAPNRRAAAQPAAQPAGQQMTAQPVGTRQTTRPANAVQPGAGAAVPAPRSQPAPAPQTRPQAAHPQAAHPQAAPPQPGQAPPPQSRPQQRPPAPAPAAAPVGLAPSRPAGSSTGAPAGQAQAFPGQQRPATAPSLAPPMAPQVNPAGGPAANPVAGPGAGPAATARPAPEPADPANPDRQSPHAPTTDPPGADG